MPLNGQPRLEEKAEHLNGGISSGQLAWVGVAIAHLSEGALGTFGSEGSIETHACALAV